MKKSFLPLAIIATASVAFTNHSNAQGLYGISAGELDNVRDELPVQITASAGGGWDSNSNTATTDENESSYVWGGLGLTYGNGTETSMVNIGASFDYIYYADQVEGMDDTFYNARGNLDFYHEFSERSSLTNNFFVSYEIEPDFEFGSISRRGDQYFYGYNRTALNFALTPRLSATTSYTITGVKYEEDALDPENRLTHIIGQSLNYALNPQTIAVLEYRFQLSDFDERDIKPTTQSILVGVERAFSDNLSGNLRLGASIYDNDQGAETTKPFFEGGLRYQASEEMSFRWTHRLGFEESELSNYEDRYTYRTAFSGDYELSPNFVVRGGVIYDHSKFEGGTEEEYERDGLSLTLGASYVLPHDFMLNAGYTFSKVSSDREYEEYDRHRVNLGLSKTF